MTASHIVVSKVGLAIDVAMNRLNMLRWHRGQES